MNERQVGAAIEGALQQEEIDIVQLAVDTHEYNDFGMVFAHGPGLDLRLRLESLKERHSFPPRDCGVPQRLKPICEASLEVEERVPLHIRCESVEQVRLPGLSRVQWWIGASEARAAIRKSTYELLASG